MIQGSAIIDPSTKYLANRPNMLAPFILAKSMNIRLMMLIFSMMHFSRSNSGSRYLRKIHAAAGTTANTATRKGFIWLPSNTSNSATCFPMESAYSSTEPMVLSKVSMTQTVANSSRMDFHPQGFPVKNGKNKNIKA